MDLTGIISISGKSGLYKVVGQGKNTIIVEALDSGKRFPTYASHKISALDDISIYTHDDDVPLIDVYKKLAENTDFKESISHKESAPNLMKKLGEILPDWDKDRVYISDIKKLFQWYNLLIINKILIKEKEEKKDAKKTPAKKAAPKKAAAKKVAPKKVAVKKAPVKKTIAKKAASKPITAGKKNG